MSKILLIFHGGCPDGFAAATAAYLAHENNWAYYAGTYQRDPPDCKDRIVLLIDFSYKRPVLEKMALDAKAVFVLDHHASAAKDLIDYSYMNWSAFTSRWVTVLESAQPRQGLHCYFDMNESGATLAWMFFFPYKNSMPTLFEHIKDYDLWAFKLPYTKEINMALRSYPQEFGTWLDLLDDVSRLRHEGIPIMRYYNQKIEDLKQSARTLQISYYVVPAVNAPYFMASDLAGQLAKGKPFAVCYWTNKDGRIVCSLRSRRDGIDVSEVAQLFGGGGHVNSAGFEVSSEQFRKFEIV